MPGTKLGGLKAASTNYSKYGKEFYKRIGQKGGKLGHTGGFAANPELAKLAGAKGGRISKRGPMSEEAKEARRLNKLNSHDSVIDLTHKVRFIKKETSNV